MLFQSYFVHFLCFAKQCLKGKEEKKEEKAEEEEEEEEKLTPTELEEDDESQEDQDVAEYPNGLEIGEAEEGEIQEGQGEEERLEADPEILEEAIRGDSKDPTQRETLEMEMAENEIDSYWRIDPKFAKGSPTPEKKVEGKTDSTNCDARKSEEVKEKEKRVLEDKMEVKDKATSSKDGKAEKVKIPKEPNKKTENQQEGNRDEESQLPYVEDLVSDEEKKGEESKGTFQDKWMGEGTSAFV